MTAMRKFSGSRKKREITADKRRKANYGRHAWFETLETRLCLNGTCEIHGMKFEYDPDLTPVQQTKEQPLAGVKIYLDSNTNGEWDELEPWAITDGNGEYAFTEARKWARTLFDRTGSREVGHPVLHESKRNAPFCAL